MAKVRLFCTSMAALAFVAGGVPAHSQTLGAVEQRINRLEQSVRDLEGQRGGRAVQPTAPAIPASQPSTVPESALIDLNGRLAALERLVASLVSGQEQDRRSISAGIDQLQRLKGDIEARMDTVEQQVTALAAAPKPVPVVAAPPPLSLTADDRFLEALGFTQKEEWAKAEFAFDTFIANNAAHPRIVEARYWLGRSFLGGGKPAQAAQVFLDLYEKHPNAPVTLDNLFALADALVAMGAENAPEACNVYGEIDAGFKDKLSAAQRNTVLEKRVALNCT